MITQKWPAFHQLTFRRFFYIMSCGLLIINFFFISGCSTLGPHSGSVEYRSTQLSSGLKKAYRVPSTTAHRVSPLIIKSADQYHVPAEWIAAIIQQESGYRSGLRSSGGAIGLGQIIPSYWANTCAGDLQQDQNNIQCSAYILSEYEKIAGSWFKAVAYYNVGPTGYKSSFWTRHQAKKYARSVKRYKKQLQKSL